MGKFDKVDINIAPNVELDKLIEKIKAERESRILNKLSNVFIEEGYFFLPDEIKRIFEKAEAFDRLGELEGITSFRGVYTNYGLRCKKLEKQNEEVKAKLREILGDLDK